MDTNFTDAQIVLLNEIAKENGITNCTIEQSKTSSKGDNYIAEIRFVTISGGTRQLDVIVKKSPDNEDFRKFFPLEHIFRNEIRVYDTVFETFRKFQEENNVKDPFDDYPKFFGKCEEKYSECLVLENLIRSGYKHWNRKLPMDTEHIKLVMATYGKFHAVSLAMKKKNPEKFLQLSGLLKQPEQWQSDTFGGFLRNVIPAIQKAVSGNVVLEKAFQRLTADLETYFKKLNTEYDDLRVINHGDCWNNNMLFKYENPDNAKNPSKLCLIDWQISKLGSPFMDISYFLCASSVKETLDDYKTYLKVYHDSLSEHLRQMSCDPEEIFPYESIEGLWKSYARYGTFVGSFVFKMLYVDTEHAPVANTGVKSMEDFYDKFTNMGNEDEVNGRIRDLLNFMVDNDFI